MTTFLVKRWFLYSIIIAFCIDLFPAQSSAFVPQIQDASNRESFNKLLQLTYNCQFKEAQELVHQVLEEDSMSIEWNYYDGMVLWRAMAAKEEYEKGRARFISIMERVVRIGEDRLTSNPQDTVALLYTGGAYGFIGMYYAHDRSFFKAASIGKKGIDLHEKLIAIAPHCYDAYLSLGLYHLVASDVPWFIKPILYIFGKSGDEAKALEYLLLVSMKGNIAVYEARLALAQLYNRRNDIEQEANIYQSLASQFPNNYWFAKIAVERLRYKRRYSEVIDIGKRIWEEHRSPVNTLSSKEQNSINDICYCLGRAYSAQGQSQKVIEIFKEMVEKKMSDGNPDDIYFLIGYNYEKEQDYENAVRWYRKVLELNSNSWRRNEAQERLEVLAKK